MMLPEQRREEGKTRFAADSAGAYCAYSSAPLFTSPLVNIKAAVMVRVVAAFLFIS